MAQLGIDTIECHATLLTAEEPLPRVVDPDVVGQAGPAALVDTLHHWAVLQVGVTGCKEPTCLEFIELRRFVELYRPFLSIFFK